LYATTDLAAVRYRVSKLGASRVIYVTDSRQKLHFQMVFDCASKAGWTGQARLEHVPFGSVLGEDNKPFKTRSGESVKLSALLDEAESRALAVVSQKNPELDAKTKQEIARVVGIGAVKYADLSNNLISDYVFSWDKMLAMEGNTAPYMQYAYARVQSIFRKALTEGKTITAGAAISLQEPAELALAKILVRYAETLSAVSRELRPHILTGYLFELAGEFSTFYNACPVLKAQEPVCSSRLALCRLTADTLKHGLSMLGIETIEQM
ncbi:MAG: arginine--tRNA ligase, partial [Sedimentisphaerales bacterium]|nr:arginine--tRNA ligase [Sedimentisphaerales bacterium]